MKVPQTGTTYEDNDIVYCEGSNCSVRVHQKCYGIEKIPKGKWVCDVCSASLSCETLKCELCPFTGGAYKKCNGNNWVHVLCSVWTEGVVCYESDTDNVLPVFDISGCNPSRRGLKCTVCNKRGNGVCIQVPPLNQGSRLTRE